MLVMPVRNRSKLTVGVLLALAALALGGLLSASRASAGPSLSYVDVAVATVWTDPSAPRAIDRPALGNPVDMRAWSRALDTAARRGLVGRIQTQALLGEPVRVLARRGQWSRVVVVDQPTPRDRRGYPGWIPTAQLTSSPSFGTRLSGQIAVVIRPTAWLRERGRALELSFGTQLPVTGVAGGSVAVLTPAGLPATLRRDAVTVYGSAAAIPPPSGAEVAATARAFLGVRYLWGGTSAFGFDCSGLVNLIYRARGVVIPRDADAQAGAGRPVPWAALRPGDSLFYGTTHVHHTALYVGSGAMIEAPDSAGSVRLVPVSRSDYAGARRFAG